MDISVIIPTYNPDAANITEGLNSLKTQTLNQSNWELIVVDNNSTNGVLGDLNLSWHSSSSIIKESRQGLTYSRLCGINYAKGNIIVMVDDDNILATDYLQVVLNCFNEHPSLGAAGGKIEGKFNAFIPPDWTKQFWGMLAIRDLGDEAIISEPSLLLNNYPDFAPVGAGMAVRKNLLNTYIKNITDNSTIITDRTGDSLSSGGDNEIVINVLKQGYSVTYFPELLLKHIIPESRLTADYLSRLNYESSKSWIRLLLKHNICPWNPIPRWSVGLRKLKSWLSFKAWASQVNHIKWRGSCGVFDGLARKK